MENFYFTFGQGHRQKNGTPMCDYWVKVIAEDAEKARQKFIEQFTTYYMTSPDKFAFQYPEKKFIKSWFVKGEYTVIY